MRLIICCGGFPTISATFITSQVLGLERRGHRVTVVAEEVNAELLAGLSPKTPSGGIYSLGRKGRHPLVGPTQKLSLLINALPALPYFFGGAASVLPVPVKGLRWTAVLSALAYHKAAVLPKVDLVHAHFGPTALWARGIAVRKRVPMAVTFHGYDATSIPEELGWGAYRTLLAAPRATFIAHSPFVAEKVRRGLDVDPWAVPLGVDTGLFKPESDARTLQKCGRGPRLAFVGNLLREKGIRVAVETLALLRGGEGEDTCKATLDVVGRGPETASTKLLAEALGIAEAVRMHGPLPPTEVAKVLRGSDFLLVPSSRDHSGAEEGYGLVSLEAQACGTLVIGSDCGGLPAAVAPPVGGRCVPQQSPSAMAHAVRELWARPDLEELRLAARQRILHSHSSEASLDAYERVFEKMTEGTGTNKPRVLEGTDPGGPMRWSEMQHFEPSISRPMGSLVAYTTGKDVLEIQRGSGADSPASLNGARRWTRMRARNLAREGAPHDGRFDVLLDLEGVGPQEAFVVSSSCAPVLRPGGLAILALELEDSGLVSFRVELEKIFSVVLLLDRLFIPGWGRSAAQAVHSRRMSASIEPLFGFRYFLCRI